MWNELSMVNSIRDMACHVKSQSSTLLQFSKKKVIEKINSLLLTTSSFLLQSFSKEPHGLKMHFCMHYRHLSSKVSQNWDSGIW